MAHMHALQMLRLASLVTGQRARVIEVISRDSLQTHRLFGLGVTPGVTVSVLQTFPGVIFQ